MSSQPIQLDLASIIASADAIIGHTLDGVITLWNRSAEGLFGFAEHDAVGRSAHLNVPEGLRAEAEEVLARVAAGEVVEHYETVRLRRDGTELHVSLTLSPIRDATGAVIGVTQRARQLSDFRPRERDARHFAAIVESSDDAIISSTLGGVVTSWNPAAEKAFGYTASEMIGCSLRTIIPEDRQSEEDRVLAAIRTGQRVDQFDTVRLKKSGERVPISLTALPIRDEAGNVLEASQIARDLNRVEPVQRDGLLLASIVDSSDDAIISKDLNSIITSWNSAAERIFGYSAAEMVGQSVRRLIPEDRQHEEDRVLERIRAGLRVEHYETLRRRKDGTLLPVSLTVSPIRRADGTIIGASKIARDISDRERAEQERKRILDIARDASRLKDEFLATLSHELRTPLNGIVGYVRLMQMGLLHDAKRDYALEAVGRSVTSLVQIVEDVLDVSRIISGKLRLEMQRLDLPAVIQSALDVVAPALGAKSIKLTVDLDREAETIVGDPERLQQVLWNVLSNAAKFTPKGGEIRIRLTKNLSHVSIAVADTGAGIAPEFLPFVFDRFRQAEGGITRARGGLGLGLAISKHLVELQGGRIFVESDGPGQGATFSIELPIQGHVRLQPVDAPPFERKVTHAGVPLPQLSGIHVLAVDDDSNALGLVREILEMTGATVTTADSVEEALSILEKTTPDVLLADLGMPHLSGLDLIDRLRRSDRAELRDLPAAALTAYARSEDRSLALQRGFNVHLPKPIEPSQLLTTVESLVKT